MVKALFSPGNLTPCIPNHATQILLFVPPFLVAKREWLSQNAISLLIFVMNIFVKQVQIMETKYSYGKSWMSSIQPEVI